MVFVVIRQDGLWRVRSHDQKLLLNLNIFKLVRGENVSGDNVTGSLALWTNKPECRHILYKKLSLETVVNLQLLRFTHIESEIEGGECNSEFRT